MSDDHLDDDLDALASAWGVEPVLAALAETDATSPPSSIRSTLFARVAAATRPTTQPVEPVDLYAGRVDELRRLLGELDPDDWHARAVPYEWSVHGLVAHLAVIEQYTAAQLGLAEPPDGDPDDHLTLGAAIIADELRRSPGETTQRWSEAAQVVIDRARTDDFDPDAPLPLHQWPFSASTALVVRSFELWTHTDDIRRATARAEVRAGSGELRTMSTLSVSALPLLLPAIAPGLLMAPTRVVLTGDGGGTFDIGGDGERSALLVADVVDYCRVVARRIEPSGLQRTVEGDAALVDALLEASRAFAI